MRTNGMKFFILLISIRGKLQKPSSSCVGIGPRNLKICDTLLASIWKGQDSLSIIRLYPLHRASPSPSRHSLWPSHVYYNQVLVSGTALVFPRTHCSKFGVALGWWNAGTVLFAALWRCVNSAHSCCNLPTLGWRKGSLHAIQSICFKCWPL